MLRVSCTAAITENVDFFVIETMLSLAETRAAVTGVRKVSSKPMVMDSRSRNSSLFIVILPIVSGTEILPGAASLVFVRFLRSFWQGSPAALPDYAETVPERACPDPVRNSGAGGNEAELLFSDAPGSS